MILARALMAGGLGMFWVLVGHGLGYPTIGAIMGVLGAGFIWCWTYPWREGPPRG